MKKFINILNESIQSKRSKLNSEISCEYYDVLNEDWGTPDVEIEQNVASNVINTDDDFEDIDVNYMTIEELLSNMHGNVSDSELDRSIETFKKLAKVFDMKVYDEIIVAVDDGEYNPNYILSSSLMVPVLGQNFLYYPEAKLISEIHNGMLYLYFATEQACKKYFAMAKKFLRDFDVDSDSVIQKEMEKESSKYESFIKNLG